MLYFKAGMALKNGTLPALKTGIPDFSDYDVVFVGSPVWWYTVSLPVLSFLSQSDFQGRAVVPFCTQGGKAGDFFARFGQEARNAKVLEGAEFSGVSGTEVSVLDERISSWLNGLRQKLQRTE